MRSRAQSGRRYLTIALCTTITGSLITGALISSLAPAAAEAPPSEKPKSMGVIKVCSQPLRIETGLVRGRIVGRSDDVQLYRGIPYAAPPVGDLRWRPPQPAHSWQGVRECYAFGAAAPQKPVALLSMFPGMALGAKTSEDCLFLNVWAPVQAAEKPLPVMVWIHGGGYLFGAGSQSLYDGTNLARRGVVVVDINYRLGPFGFLAHPQLSAESKEGASGNYGILDQIEALRWVKRNIASFGGDPERVTIFGESAGGNSVYALLMSPLAKGLFQRAISESGAGLNYPFLKQSRYGLRSAEKMGLEFAKKCGVSAGPGQLAALRTLSADDVLKASSAFETARTIEFHPDRIRFAPVVDGWVIPDDPRTLFEKGRVNAVPLIVGANANEGSLFTLALQPLKGPEEYHALLEKEFGPDAAKKLVELYPPTNLRRAVNDLVGDYLFVAPTRFVARAFEQARIPVYLYQFAHPTPGAMGKMLGAHHGAEIAYVFDNLQLAPHHAAVDEQIRDALVNYWIQFAATGDPNRPGMPAWPRYDSSDRSLVVADTITTEQGIRKAKLDAIDALVEEWRKNDGHLTQQPHAATAAPKRSAQSALKSGRPNRQPAVNKTTNVQPKQSHLKPAVKPADRPLRLARRSRVAAPIPLQTAVSNRPAIMAPKPVTRAGAPVVQEMKSRLRQARFFAKAGLGSLAVESLREIVKDTRGTAFAREAQQILDSIPKSSDPSLRRAVTANAAQ